MKESILAEFNAVTARRGSLHGHMHRLKELAAECQHVTEFGVWHVNSTWAFLLGCPGKVVSYDCSAHKNVARAQKIAPEWVFILGDDLKANIEPTDLLFIDSEHTGEHLDGLFKRHADKVRKYIVLHDTVTFGPEDHGGLWKVVMDFVGQGAWKIKEHHKHCHGLTVLERV